MATQNATLTADWLQIAGVDEDPLLISVSGNTTVEVVASSPGGPAPELEGHALGPGQGLTRVLLGPGLVFARLRSGSTAKLIVTGSSLTLT